MRRKFNEDIDRKITECLNNKAEEISTPENMFFKIRGEILKEKKGGFLDMKFRFLKGKTIIVAGLLCIATTVSCVAATNGRHWISSTSRATEIKNFPTEDKVKDTVGFSPKYVDSFENGFKFESFNVCNEAETDDNGNEVRKLKSAEFDYKKAGAQKGQSLSMNAQAIDEKEFDQNIEMFKDNMTEYKGVKIYYHSMHNKFVPEGYVKAEEEIKLMEEGKLNIGYGSDEIRESDSQSVYWYQNGIQYSIFNMEYNDVDKDQMIKMAQNVIDK
ncbi:hypothetical protein [Clostridium weizhouense]|uniref:DUF4367 domain-containing protein n=1 Tax=Clostridium weizhouense TaxID=2859781 RepID=A0ABS7AST0_9CLOT|nr:hypothetical protein [Clostridium weizhouense]MBW6410716.1 hypothetical protein [Clostridium weizhouense]